jgi:tRNA-dihydrouridine synthase 1
VEFQTTPEDRPLVAHFSANDPHELLAAALLVQDQCDAIDLVLRVPAALPFLLPSSYLTTPVLLCPWQNLGCPQRVAHAGHFGSYLLGDEDRPLVLDIVRTVSQGTHRHSTPPIALYV